MLAKWGLMPRSCLLVARDFFRIWTLNWLTSQPEIGSGILGVSPSPSMLFKRLGEGFVVEFHCPNKPSNVWYIYLYIYLRFLWLNHAVRHHHSHAILNPGLGFPGSRSLPLTPCRVKWCWSWPKMSSKATFQRQWLVKGWMDGSESFQFTGWMFWPDRPVDRVKKTWWGLARNPPEMGGNW